MLYQLSYSRMPAANVTTQSGLIYRPGSHGGEGDRTPDLVNAIHALSQLSYAPVILGPRKAFRREHGILPGRCGDVKRSQAFA